MFCILCKKPYRGTDFEKYQPVCSFSSLAGFFLVFTLVIFLYEGDFITFSGSPVIMRSAIIKDWVDPSSFTTGIDNLFRIKKGPQLWQGRESPFRTTCKTLTIRKSHSIFQTQSCLSTFFVPWEFVDFIDNCIIALINLFRSGQWW